ncbi:MAG: hypothetical protein KKB39_05800, partial [Nanoarchaeota archaeon]|nr:hypothetical protein [Nanoarchaeota archaeon]
MKRGFSLLTALTAIPLVSAGVVEDSLEFIFGATQEGGIFVKLGLFIILFSFLMISMKKVFPPEHKNAGIIVALVIALIAMKFMPEQWVVGLGQMIWIIALILLPYMILSIFFKDTSGKKKYVFWTLLISSYVLLIYFVSQVGRNNQLRYYLSFGNETVDDLWYAISSNEWIFYAVIPALIVLFLIIRKAKKSKEGDDSGESKSGPGWLDNWKERRHKKKMDSLEVKKQKA